MPIIMLSIMGDAYDTTSARTESLTGSGVDETVHPETAIMVARNTAARSGFCP
jgi:hypothetical protein